MALLVGADCVPGNVSLLPNVDWYGGYPDGLFVSFFDIRAAHPDKPVVAYTVLGHPMPPFQCAKLILDVEPGNPVTAAGVPGWIRQQMNLGWPFNKLAISPSSSMWRPIDSSCANAGIQLTWQNRMVAQWDGIQSLSDIRDSVGLFPADHFGAKQYTDKGGPVVGGGNHAYDLSVCLPEFLTAHTDPPTPTEDIVAIACSQNHDGQLHVFVEREDGRVEYTWQKNDNSWNGGKTGVSVADFKLFAPAPDKK